MADKKLPIETGLRANALLPKGEERLAITRDSAELFLETAGVVTKLATVSIRGSDITVAPSSWAEDEEGLSAIISEPNVPAENEFVEYQVNVVWHTKSLETITGTIITDTIASGGAYKLILFSDTPPDESIAGQVTISRISKGW